ncbi:MAG: CvpA family protein [Faecalibacillus faecis]|uniref:CvpA family protein n=1 Tax=Faecalibacillus faecis TaxID=1982628 RepID=UPI003994CE62
MDNFIQIIKEKMNHFSFHSNYTPSSKKWSYIIPLLVVLILSIVGEYVLLLPIHFQSQTFIFHLIFLLVLFAMLHAILLGTIDQVSKVFAAISLGLLIYVGIGSVYSAPIFHAKNYQKQLLLDKKADFYKDNETISYQSIPVVDRESAIKLGDRKMGQMIDYVSQFEVDESYEQINYQETPYRVTPLEYSDLIKWVTNRKEGLPAYIKVNMVTQESEVVELKEGMKYSKSEHFGRNIYRHLRMNYPTKMFEELAFEIDEKGTLYWIAPVFEYQIGPFGGKDIVGAVLVDAVTGKHKYYDINDIPSWVDRVYPANLVISQLENYGKYTNGYINSIFSQKGVLQPTDGYNYIVIKDDVYLYTGLTSVSKDASNVGFALINLRTKEGKYYHISGAEEYSAMSSAEGKVQNLKYKATFPILINAGGEPTYFLSLKDSSNLVKMYAFVSVKNYQIVATGSSVSEAEKAYYEVLSQNGKSHVEAEESTLTGKIALINSAVKEGNSVYYFKLEGDDHIYIADLSLSNSLPLVEVGDEVEIQFISNEHQSVVISQFKAK